MASLKLRSAIYVSLSILAEIGKFSKPSILQTNRRSRHDRQTDRADTHSHIQTDRLRQTETPKKRVGITTYLRKVFIYKTFVLSDIVTMKFWVAEKLRNQLEVTGPNEPATLKR